MKRNKIAMLLAIALLLALCASCSQDSPAPTGGSSASPSAGAAQTPDASEPSGSGGDPEPAGPENMVSLPLEDPITLSIWINDMPHIYSYVDDWTVVNASKTQLETLTNVNLEFVLCMDAAVQLSIIAASQEFPDLYFGAANYYSGGASKGADDGLFLILDDYIQDYLPLYYEAITSDESIHRATTTTDGHYITAYQLYTEYPYNDAGPVVRGDWLDEFGMTASEIDTIAEYHDYLAAAKNAYGAQLIVTSYAMPYQNWFCGAFGVAGHFENDVMITYPWYQENGVVKFGVMEPGYLECLRIFADWYSEGLISEDFLNYTFIMAPDKDKMATGTYSMWWWGAHQSDSLYSLQDDPGFSLSTLNEITDGTMQNPFGVAANLVNPGTEISPTTEHLYECLAFVNFGFTDDAYWAYNYGIEGETYELDAAGNVAYTDMIMNAANGMVPDTATSAYLMFNFGGHYRDPNSKYKIAGMFSDDTIAMVDSWSSQISQRDDIGYLPSTLALSLDDASTYASIMSEVSTYMAEMLPAFMMGTRSLDEWDDFLAQCETLGINDAKALYQNAYDAYLAK